MKIVSLLLCISASMRFRYLFAEELPKKGANFGIRCVVILKITHLAETRNYH